MPFPPKKKKDKAKRSGEKANIEGWPNSFGDLAGFANMEESASHAKFEWQPAQGGSSDTASSYSHAVPNWEPAPLATEAVPSGHGTSQQSQDEFDYPNGFENIPNQTPLDPKPVNKRA